MGQKQKREKTEGATGLSRITREQTEKWNQMTAVSFQTAGRYQKRPASLWAEKELIVYTQIGHIVFSCADLSA